jgi:MoCo/4Fe-4S cofactor protein with predicted Tat translocation signal
MTRDTHRDPSTIGVLTAQIEAGSGPEYWRSLDELANTPEFRAFVQNEFAEGVSEWPEGLERRSFLKMMGASFAFAGLAACTRQPIERIVPHVRAPEDMIPGKPLFFASAHVHGGYAVGTLVESHSGRPTKVEGNPDHPASLGATDAFAQASILELYDPDRSHTVRRLGQISTWERFARQRSLQEESLKISNGAGFRILTETVTSPTLHAQIQSFLEAYPEAKWHQFEPANRDNFKLGAQSVFGRTLDAVYEIERASVILSLDADFLSTMPGHLVYARQFAKRREPGNMNRLYVVEPSPSNAGACADHRLALADGDVELFVREIAFRLGIPVEGGNAFGSDDFVDALVEDLRDAGSSALVIAGANQSQVVHALAHEINARLGSLGTTVRMIESVEPEPMIQADSIRDLIDDLEANDVDSLLMLGGNPVHTVPAGLRFVEAMQKATMRIHLSDRFDETSRLCHWHIPRAHDLEAWSDARAFDGTVTIVQPLIEPLYGGRSVHEVMSVYLGVPGAKSYGIVKDYWKNERGGPAFETFWQTALHDGYIPDTASPDARVRTQSLTFDAPSKHFGLRLTVRPDPNVWDGRYANNGWLQELPKPISLLTWENVVWMSPKTAKDLGVRSGDIVRLTVAGEGNEPDLSAEIPVWEQPGQHPQQLTVHLGYGRTHAGAVANGMGVSASALLRTSSDVSRPVSVVKTGVATDLATVQDHSSMEGRDLVRVGDLEAYRSDPGFAQHGHHVPPAELTMYDPAEHQKDGYQWGMAVDLNGCIGCNACTIACQSENNIPIVGKDQVLNGREMHWLRIDRYYKGSVEEPEIHHQPVACVHCEEAPCEVVCPVNATVHGDEGLNEMVYNRCVGTRYCSNNCPYKVRRFNFLQYVDEETESYKLMRNPDVTVRARGVMEKCTYCVQRINLTRITSKLEDRSIRDGEIVTACEQVCPTDAIVFGDVSDPNSRVSKMKASQRNYGLLESLGTRPRTTYLAKLKNPNPMLVSRENRADESHHG